MQKKAQFKNGYTFNRVINGCWQLSAEHCLQGHLDYDDAIRAFHELWSRDLRRLTVPTSTRALRRSSAAL